MSKSEDKAKRKAAKKAEKAAQKEKIHEDSNALPAFAHVVESKKDKKQKRKLEDGVEEETRTSKKLKKDKEDEPTASAELEEAPKAEEGKKRKDKKDKASEEPATEGGEAQEAANGANAEVAKPEKKSKKSKRQKPDSEKPVAEKLEITKAKDTTLQQDFISLEGKPVRETAPSTTNNGEATKKERKKAKKERKAAKEDKLEAKEERTVEANGVDTSPEEDLNGEEKEYVPAEKNGRFIVFVGNLPFSATKEDIQKHFSSVSPTEIRLMTDKKSGKSRGFAFVEFDRYDHMKTCLKLYHHTAMQEGTEKGRKINVELTAGGGGNNDERKAKLQAKNEKLADERQRRFEHEEKQKQRKEKKEERQKKSKSGEKVNTIQGLDGLADVPSDVPSSGADEHAGMHPSRLAMMQKSAPAANSPWRGRQRF
ncbi:hypothetical protein K469DRAFT_654296 [Zopfia rhizophila CBS 207.26]|uniref:RRM domain-containing protein n=1 Tax=Zopfia rhizophila CBS 207.26 TaxID=1314779 RepID=A0A6A6EN56_9PEZI|nr:hypothetical protein K469DRAFT_654296 [Zopfia rhizophila CBS 207.26]